MNKIHAAFNAAFGNAVSVYAAVVDEKLVIAKVTEYNLQARPDTTLISNNPLVAADVRFSSSDFQAAWQAYQVLMSSNQCVIQQDLARYRLDNVIDRIGQKENGEEKFNIDELSNGHWAILAICLYFYRQIHTTQNMEKAMSFLDDLGEFYQKHSQIDDYFRSI